MKNTCFQILCFFQERKKKREWRRKFGKRSKHRRDKNMRSFWRRGDLGFVSFPFTRAILSRLEFGEGALAVIINVLITAARGHASNGSRDGWTAAERPPKGSTLTRARILEPTLSFSPTEFEPSLLFQGRKKTGTAVVAIDETRTFQFFEGGDRNGDTRIGIKKGEFGRWREFYIPPASVIGSISRKLYIPGRNFNFEWQSSREWKNFHRSNVQPRITRERLTI